MVFGIILGPVSAKFLDSERWGSAEPGQTEDIALVSGPNTAVIACD
jgi:sodium/hydrogen antiporter